MNRDPPHVNPLSLLLFLLLSHLAGTSSKESTVKFSGTDGGEGGSPTFKKAAQRRRSGGNIDTSSKDPEEDVFVDPEEQVRVVRVRARACWKRDS